MFLTRAGIHKKNVKPKRLLTGFILDIIPEGQLVSRGDHGQLVETRVEVAQHFAQHAGTKHSFSPWSNNNFFTLEQQFFTLEQKGNFSNEKQATEWDLVTKGSDSQLTIDVREKMTSRNGGTSDAPDNIDAKNELSIFQPKDSPSAGDVYFAKYFPQTACSSKQMSPLSHHTQIPG